MAYLLLLFGILMRLVPHAPNFTPVGAIALFGGATLPGAPSFFLPLALMVVSDALIGFHDVVVWTWGSFLAVGLIGRWVGRDAGYQRMILGAVASSILFFVVTNFGVWMSPASTYAKTLSGLALCYAAAIPFFRNEIFATVGYSFVMFGMSRFAESWIRRRQVITVRE